MGNWSKKIITTLFLLSDNSHNNVFVHSETGAHNFVSLHVFFFDILPISVEKSCSGFGWIIKECPLQWPPSIESGLLIDLGLASRNFGLLLLGYSC
ncbi:hypothetical protein CDAR_463441 [Caerostris darwini]|uniref:Uncharacterized protein n=1 Tax=Caerostris darwini TaxID=1538125 RepID=A0AAV4QVS5_9ARAC|nr:hypothetical protein CDAR_463441 [Caerostris darwini]